MATITSILNRISEMGSRIGKNSIGKNDLFGLLTDMVKRQQSTELNMSNLSLRKIYASIAAMNADVAAPVGDDGEKILKGQLVVISAVGADMGKVYRYSGTAWDYAGQIGDLSQKIDKSEYISRVIPYRKNYIRIVNNINAEFLSADYNGITGFIKVSRMIKVSTTLWRSSNSDYSSPIIGFDENKLNPVIVFNPNIFQAEAGLLTLTEYEIAIPEEVVFVKVPNRQSAEVIVGTYVANIENVAKTVVDTDMIYSEVSVPYLANRYIQNSSLSSELSGTYKGITDFIKVSDYFRVTTTLWRSSIPDFSSPIVGYDSNKLNPVNLINPNDLQTVSGVVTLTDYYFQLPDGISYIRVNNRESEEIVIGTMVDRANYKASTAVFAKLTNIEYTEQTMINGKEIRALAPTTIVDVADGQLSYFVKVLNDRYLFTCALWKSSVAANSTGIIGYTDEIGSNPYLLYNANDSVTAAGNYILLRDYEIIIPPSIKYFRYNHKITSGITAKAYPSFQAYKHLNSGIKYADIRGEIGVNNIHQLNIDGHTGCHDCQVIVKSTTEGVRLFVLYRSTTNFHIVVRDPYTNALITSKDVVAGGMVGWAPRMYSKSTDIIRIIYTKAQISVYYRDYTVSTDSLGVEIALQVAIKQVGGAYDAPTNFTLNNFLQHVANVSGIDYRDSAFDGFSSRNLLVEDTQQLQKVGSKYYLTSEVLADSMPLGDCGGIACAMWSEDLDVWYLNNPINITNTIDNQRDHEISITYIGGKWHALTRWNRYNFDGTSGHRHYTSLDAETWISQGIIALEGDFTGLRHAIFKYSLKYANPYSSNSNKTEKEFAFLAFQKNTNIQGCSEYDDASHRLRTEITLVYTANFVDFIEVANFKNRRNMTYPSMFIYNDVAYIAVSSGHFGMTGLFTDSIAMLSINLGNI